jgi:hypothetical protein
VPWLKEDDWIVAFESGGQEGRSRFRGEAAQCPSSRACSRPLFISSRMCWSARR